jgi:hypothetical protein
MKTTGQDQKERTAWWTPEVRETVRANQKAFRKWIMNRTAENRENYETLRNQAKTEIRQAKRDMWNKIGQDLEEDHSGNKKLMYSMAKRYRKQQAQKGRNIKDGNGNTLFGEEAINERWNEYFNELLNVDVTTQDEENEIPTDETETTQDDEEISMEEIEKAVKRTKNNKSPGPDQIPIEVVKAAGDPMIHFLHKMFNTAYRTGQVPPLWNKSEICPIFKNKGDAQDCKNYRGISLMSHVGKVYERILEHRLRSKVEETLSEEQSGFRPGRGTVDQISALKIFLEKSWGFGMEKHICFLDLEKAFDRVPRAKMWSVIAETGISTQLLQAIKSTYHNQESTVTGGRDSFSVSTGVRQGSVLSPLLFIVYLDRVMKEVPQTDSAECFAYADDIAQVANTKEQLERIMDMWMQAFRKYGLKLSIGKTEYMMVGRGAEANTLKLEDNELAYTDSFTYLGSKLESQNHMESEILNRITKYTKNVAALYPLLREKSIPRKVKTSIYTSILRPTLIYGSETWTLTEKLKSKLQAAEMRTLRLIFGVTLKDRKRNVDIRRALEVEPLILTF